MITIFCYCPEMTRDDENFIADAAADLARQLKEEPIELPIRIKRCGDEPILVKKLDGVLSDSPNMFRDWSANIDYLFVKSGLSTTDCAAKLLVYCPPDNAIARAARKEQPAAVWGAALSPLAAVYNRNNKVAVWHEMLHLLRAEDCYMDDNPSQKKSDCNLDGCMMEYAAPKSTCKRVPFLCDKNVRRLRQLLCQKKGVE